MRLLSWRRKREVRLISSNFTLILTVHHLRNSHYIKRPLQSSRSCTAAERDAGDQCHSILNQPLGKPDCFGTEERWIPVVLHQLSTSKICHQGWHLSNAKDWWPPWPVREIEVLLNTQPCVWLLANPSSLRLMREDTLYYHPWLVWISSHAICANMQCPFSISTPDGMCLEGTQPWRGTWLCQCLYWRCACILTDLGRTSASPVPCSECHHEGWFKAEVVQVQILLERGGVPWAYYYHRRSET